MIQSVLSPGWQKKIGTKIKFAHLLHIFYQCEHELGVFEACSCLSVTPLMRTHNFVSTNGKFEIFSI